METPADSLAAIQAARAAQLAAVEASKAADEQATRHEWRLGRNPWRSWRTARRARQRYGEALAATDRYHALLLEAAAYVDLPGAEDPYAVQSRLHLLQRRARRQWHKEIDRPTERGSLAHSLLGKRRIGLAAS